MLRDADAIVEEEIRAAGLYEAIWQSFGVLLPVQIGRRDGRRAHLRGRARACARCTRSDGMTADWVQLPYELLGDDLDAHHQRGRGINRVVYDISSKPPAHDRVGVACFRAA